MPSGRGVWGGGGGGSIAFRTRSEVTINKHNPHIRPLKDGDDPNRHIGTGLATTQEAADKLLQLSKWLGMLVEIDDDQGEEVCRDTRSLSDAPR